MIRRYLVQSAAQNVTDPFAFRWRGGEVSRLEGFSDAVFGFAITLLVVSLEVPRTFDELANTLRGFIGFAVCFTLLTMVWYDHYVFFRQYGLSDTLTVVLNLVLLFVVMFYVYPLKFLFTLLVTLFTGLAGGGGGGVPVIRATQWPMLMIIYGAGFVAVHGVFTLMYLHAHRKRELLDLNRIEVFDTKANIGCYMVLMAIGLCSIALALVGTPRITFLSGMMYWLIGPAMAGYWGVSGHRRRRLTLIEQAKLALAPSP